MFQNFWLDSWKGVQFFTSIGTGRVFVRVYNNANKWAPIQWKELATKDDVARLTQSTPWQNLVLANGWNHHQQYENVQYCKSFDGVVYLRGTANKGKTAAGTVLGTLPVGYRPSKSIYVSALNNSYTIAVLGIEPTGNIIVKANVDATWLNFDNVSFKI